MIKCGKSFVECENGNPGGNGVIEVGRDDKLTEGKVSLAVSSFASHKEIPFGGGANGNAGSYRYAAPC